MQKKRNFTSLLAVAGLAGTLLLSACGTTEIAARSPVTRPMPGHEEKAAQLQSQVFAEARRVDRPMPGQEEKAAQLQSQVFAEARRAEHTFDVGEVSSLEIFTCLHHAVNVTVGGDKLVIRYDEWVDGHYTLSLNDDGMLLLEETIPYREWDGWYNRTSVVGTNWLTSFLFFSSSRGGVGVHPPSSVEIVVPEHMVFDDLTVTTQTGRIRLSPGLRISGNLDISTLNRDLTLQDIQVGGNATFETMNAPIIIRNSTFGGRTNIGTVNARVNVTGSTFADLNVAIASGNSTVALLGDVKNYDIIYNAANERVWLEGLSTSTLDILDLSIRNTQVGGNATLESVNAHIRIENSTLSGRTTIDTVNARVSVAGSTLADLNVTGGSWVGVTGSTFTDLNVTAVFGSLTVTLVDGVENYDIIYVVANERPWFQGLLFNGRIVDPDTLRNPTARSRIDFTTVNGRLTVNESQLPPDQVAREDAIVDNTARRNIGEVTISGTR